MALLSIVRRTAAALALTLVVSLTGVATPATANEGFARSTGLLTADQVAQLRSLLAENGVDAATSEALVAKMQRGELWDSFRPDVAPVSEVTTLDGQYTVTRSVYPDGSVVISTVSRPTDGGTIQGGATPEGVTGCQLTYVPGYAAYYKNCKADVNLVAIRMGFYFDFERINGVGAKITAWRDRFHHCLCTLADHRIERRSNTKVRYSADVTVGVGPISAGWVAWMEAEVNMSSAWTNHN
jgi:hypothetical protein